MTITAPSPAAAAPIASYSFRRSILEREKTYTLYPDRLEVAAEGEMPGVYPLDQVDEVHLKFDRTKQRAYFSCFIHTADGKIALRHVHWGGVANFQDRRETYTPFVRALLLALANRPGIYFHAGSLLNFLTAIVGLPLVVVLGLAALAADRMVGVGLAALLAFMCLSILPRSRPRRFDPRNPPAALLPM
ncbi:MAG TPA: hypothetical protein VHG08_10165 [Longimicrobium sp.]|nr:hypothetical protein [Longimicrobium sp.]